MREGDVFRLADILEGLGFSTEDDLGILSTAFFETMIEQQVPAVMVQKLWRTLNNSVHIPVEDFHGVRGHGHPTYPRTLTILDQMNFNARQCERQCENRKGNVVKSKVGPGFADLNEQTIKLQESHLGMMEDQMLEEGGKGTAESTPHKTSTGPPACQGVQRQTRQRVAFSGAAKLQMPSKRRQSGISNPDALCGRVHEEDDNLAGADAHEGNLWSALPDLNTSARDFEEPSAEGAARQKTPREKMIIKAVSELSPFSDVAEDFLVWRDSAVVAFRQAGRGPVLEHDFYNWAADQGRAN